MDHYTGMLANGSLLSNPLDGSCVEMGSSNAAMHRDCDAGLDKDSDHVHDDDDGHGHELVPHGEEEVLYEHDDGAHMEGRRVKRKKYRGPRSWKEKWQELHPWAFVRTVNGDERMFCTVCEAHGNTSTRNAFRKEGSSNFQPSALSTHANSSAHKNALLMQKAWAEAGKMGITNKGRGKVPAVTEYSVIANHLATMASKLSNVVTRDEFDALKAEWRIIFVRMCEEPEKVVAWLLRFRWHVLKFATHLIARHIGRQRRKDARRINCCCALTDPLMPVPTLDGMIPENLPNSLAELVALPTEHVEALLMAYDLPVHGTVDAKLRRLKAYLGFRH